MPRAGAWEPQQMAEGVDHTAVSGTIQRSGLAVGGQRLTKFVFQAKMESYECPDSWWPPDSTSKSSLTVIFLFLSQTLGQVCLLVSLHL